MFLGRYSAITSTTTSNVQARVERQRTGCAGSRKAHERDVAPTKNDSANWDSTRNIFIEGDNLEVLKLLQKSYHRKAKLVYVDPPYNTGRDIIYPGDNPETLDTYLKFASKTWLGASCELEASGRYHTNWLNMMYPRLFLARNLLRDDGYFAASIDDTERKNLDSLLDEIFGEENRLAALVLDRSRKNDARFFSVGHGTSSSTRETRPCSRPMMFDFVRLRKESRISVTVQQPPR